jgi:aspartate-semialdehyde dehydrogenase
MARQPIKVGILGATGTVGQRYVLCCLSARSGPN